MTPIAYGFYVYQAKPSHVCFMVSHTVSFESLTHLGANAEYGAASGLYPAKSGAFTEHSHDVSTLQKK